MSGKRRKYIKEFKTESAEYLLKSGKPMTEVSESQGVDHWLLSKKLNLVFSNTLR